MNKLIKSIVLGIALLLAMPVYAAEDISISANGKTVTIMDVTNDWTWTDSFTDTKYADGIRVNYIRFHPGATDDICSIEDYNDNDVKHFLVKCADTYDDRIQYYNGAKLRLSLDVDDTDGTWTASYTAGCSVTIQLWPTQEP
jgi:hypothetical protein